MRTLTAIALATALLFTVTAAQATTHKKHKSHHSAQTKKPKTDEKAGEKAK